MLSNLLLDQFKSLSTVMPMEQPFTYKLFVTFLQHTG